MESVNKAFTIILSATKLINLKFGKTHVAVSGAIEFAATVSCHFKAKITERLRSMNAG